MLGDGFSGLIFEKGGKLSIGRILLIITFVAAMVRWVMGTDIPSSMLNVLLALLAYVLGTKVVGNVSETLQQIKGVTSTVVNTVNQVTGKETVADIEPPANMRGDN